MKSSQSKYEFSEQDKQKILKELNDFNNNLLSYRRRQEQFGKTRLTDNQKKNLDALRSRLQNKYRWLKKAIAEYGGDASIKVVGITWDAFVYSLRSLYMIPDQFTSLDKAINLTRATIEKIESIPVNITELKVTTITRKPIDIKDTNKELSHLFDKMQLHPIIRRASKSLFDSGHYAEAILATFKAVNNFIKRRRVYHLTAKI